MQTKHFIVCVSFFVILTILLQPAQGQCTSSSGCNNQSSCDVGSGFCSCLSGFSGDQCLTQPQSSCFSSYNEPNSDSSFDATIESSLTLGVFNIQVNTSLERTRYVDATAVPLVDDTSSSSTHSLSTSITLSGSSSCNYPAQNSVWIKSAVVSGSCVDSYVLRLDWNNVQSNCGFVLDQESNEWISNITVTRYYSTASNDSVIQAESHKLVLIRSESVTQTIRIKPDTQHPTTVTNEQDAATPQETQEEAELMSSSDDDRVGFNLKQWQIAMVAAASVFGACFIGIIATALIIRRRNAKKAQAAFNFSEFDSN